jgi:guanidinoacetate N-methyltransferase
MTRRIKRSKEYELILEIKDDGFIRPPRDSQRNAVLNRAMGEFAADLNALDHVSKHFVSGALDIGIDSDRSEGHLTDEQIMEDWQLPIMQAMSEIVADSHGDVLEVGFGRGISSGMIQQQGVQSHTIIECNTSIIERFQHWKSDQANQNIIMVEGMWQDTIDNLPQYDGIFFHTYPLNEEEYMKYVHGKVTFAEHFFPVAAEHLKPGGVFTYFSNEIDSLSRAHQRSLFQYFKELSIKRVSLDMPPDVKDTWWANSMVIVKAIK